MLRTRSIRSRLLIGILCALAGCSSFRDVFTSHADTAARVGNKELESAKVAEIITRLGGPTANPDASNLITGIWVDLNLFAGRVAEGTLKADSALSYGAVVETMDRVRRAGIERLGMVTEPARER